MCPVPPYRSLPWLRISPFVFLLAIFCLTQPCQANDKDRAAQPPLPNIVLIMLDDLGYGDFQCFNQASKIETPNINQLASQGIRFTDAHAPGPLCHMSRYGLLTGRYPFRTNVSLWPKQPLIKPDQLTLAKLAQSHGYRTHMVGKWHLGFEEKGYDQPLAGGPVDCGFDTFFGIRASTDIPPYFYIRDQLAVLPPTDSIPANRSPDWSPIQGAFWRAGAIAPNLKLENVTPDFTREAISVIQRHADRPAASSPLFLYLAYPSPHTPWLPADTFRGKSGAGLYGDFVMTVDHEIGKVLQALTDSQLEENTIVILTSDNGPVWYPQDVERYTHDSAGGLRGMKSDAWEAGHRMPLIVRWPEVGQGGSSNDHLICFTDFLATFAELFQAMPPTKGSHDSFSFLSQLTGDAAHPSFPPRTQLVIQAGSVASTKTVRSGPWKLITASGSGGFTQPNRIPAGPGIPAGQLYDLSVDRGETNNLYKQRPKVVERLQQDLRRIVSEPHGGISSEAKILPAPNPSK